MMSERIVNRMMAAGSRLADEQRKDNNEQNISYWKGYRDALNNVLEDWNEFK